ncbi:hypothetical protein PUNSTDRAFT_82382 [Punctularia strigosozonata HHB-11173 SS5]|uniref:uncharacterized protein n=1 Tax=Punctularia strigosozonata (strain HHB-11173) TaxID=741275 RepID=UPI0004417387|nr:uncharacterized protein PUNSTDRAFT_82382 [Punctularia strigosozonata HHB-11173 SS5]EIN12913.1 hypothetical protein PUNSTDRAFT_82382 [Punctularia strigosozonata HHB-11173 SS5]
MMFKSFAAVLFAAAGLVAATPIVHPTEDIVFTPTITDPTAVTTWAVGSNQTVTWDTSKIPAEAQNSTGVLLLGYQQSDDDSEHLDIAHPLAAQFPISAGSVAVTVPNVTTRNDYIVVLIGDSGNKSPKFTIQ